MRSATSSFKTLLRSDWKHYWPLCFLYTFILFFILPVGLWNQGGYYSYPVLSELDAPLRHMNNHVLEVIQGMPVLTMLAGLGLAMALFSYLMRTGSVGLMHALPVRRSTQFAAHFTAGMTMLTAGNIVTLLLSVLMEIVVAGKVGIGALAIWLLVTELEGFFFLAFATLCAVITGWVLAVPVIFVGVNFMVMAYRLLLENMFSTFYRGYTGSDGGLMATVAMWCTPVVKLIQNTGTRAASDDPLIYAMRDSTWTTVLVYTLAGMVMLAAAWLFYRARHSETAGNAITVRWLRPVVRYVIAIAGGMALGALIYAIISWGRESRTTLVICQIIMGLLVYCAVEMLLRKTYKIFDRRTVAGLAALALVLVLIPAAIRMDAFGYQRRLPAAEQVQAVEINGTYCNNFTSADPDTIAAAMEMHRLLIDRGGADNGSDRSYFYVRYTLKDGSTLTRSYDYTDKDPALEPVLETLLNRPEARIAGLMWDYGRFGATFTGGYATNWMTGRETVLSAEQCAALYAAIGEDAERFVSLETLRQQYYTGTRQAQLDLELSTTEGAYRIYNVMPECTSTLALLQEYGVFNEVEEIFPRAEEDPSEEPFPGVTTADKRTVEYFAAAVRSACLSEDWETLSGMLQYPIALSETVTCDNAGEFVDYMNGHGADPEFLRVMESAELGLWANGEGISMSAGTVWLRDVNFDGVDQLAPPELKVFSLIGIAEADQP